MSLRLGTWPALVIFLHDVQCGSLISCNTYTPLRDFSFCRSDRRRHVRIDFNRLCVSRVFVKWYNTDGGKEENVLEIFHRTKKKNSIYEQLLKTQSPSKDFAILLRASRRSLSLSILLLCCRWSMTRSRRAKFLYVFFPSTWTAELKKKYVLVSRIHNMYIPTCSRTRECPTPPTALYVPVARGCADPSTDHDYFVHGKSTGFRTLIDQAALFATFVRPYHNVQHVTHIRIHTRISKSIITL